MRKSGFQIGCQMICLSGSHWVVFTSNEKLQSSFHGGSRWPILTENRTENRCRFSASGWELSNTGVNPLPNRKLNMWTVFCNVCINFLNSQIWKEIRLELNDKPSRVTTFSTDLSFQNLFFWNLFEFSVQKSLLNQYLPHPESKSYQINSIKSCSSRSFQQHQRHIPIPLKFSAKISFNFSEEIIQFSRTFASQVQTPCNQAHAPLLVESFPKTSRTRSKASRFSDLIITKQNKLPSLIDRFVLTWQPSNWHNLQVV